jgi:3-isopropylmalate dehydrogenase
MNNATTTATIKASKPLSASILVVAGDGVGPEVTRETVRVLEAVGAKFGHTFTWAHELIGGCAIDATGSALPEATVHAAQKADAVLLGSVGGPKWDDPALQARVNTRPEAGLLAIRKVLKLYANLRPVRVIPALADCSPLRPELLQGVDFLVVRELTGGLYFGQPKERRKRSDGGTSAVDTLEYHDYEITRILELAFVLAQSRRKHVASVDKANVLETSRLWRETATALAPRYADVTLAHVLVDTAAMRLVMSPKQFDVLVTENTFGDILTDEAAVLTGSMGLLPSASLGEDNNRHGFPLGLYEPIHGSAPDIAGKGIANPVGTILSGAMLLRHSLGLEHEAQAIESAVESVLADGLRTADLVQSVSANASASAPAPVSTEAVSTKAVSTKAMTDAILAALAAA